MKITQISKLSGLVCENFGYYGKIKRLPDTVKFSPQHIITDGSVVKLLYYKPSYDNRFIEFNRQEINCIRKWNQDIHTVLVFVFNYTFNKYTTFTIDEINRKMFSCKKETVDKFLFNNDDFKWFKQTDRLDINYGSRY